MDLVHGVDWTFIINLDLTSFDTSAVESANLPKMLTKFETKSARVKGLSFHPKRPWILARYLLIFYCCNRPLPAVDMRFHSANSKRNVCSHGLAAELYLYLKHSGGCANNVHYKTYNYSNYLQSLTSFIRMCYHN